MVISVILEAGLDIAGVFDDDAARHGTQVLGHEVLGAPERILELGFQKAIVAIGDNHARQKIIQRFPTLDWQTLVHPKAYVHPNAQIGAGTVVMVNTVIRPNVVIGDHVIINTSAVVGHECVVEDYAHVAGSVHLGGECHVSEGAFLGLGTVAVPGIRIGAWSIVGAGGAVIRDIPAYTLAAGVPARPKKSVSR